MPRSLWGGSCMGNRARNNHRQTQLPFAPAMRSQASPRLANVCDSPAVLAPIGSCPVRPRCSDFPSSEPPPCSWTELPWRRDPSWRRSVLFSRDDWSFVRYAVFAALGADRRGIRLRPCVLLARGAPVLRSPSQRLCLLRGSRKPSSERQRLTDDSTKGSRK